MAVTMAEVRAALEPEEPNYAKAAQLGPEALPHLKKLVAEAEPMLASKATYLTGLIAGEGAVDLLREAATHREPIVRVAAAGAARLLPAAAASQVLAPLLNDADSGVRRVAKKAAPERSNEPRGGVENGAQRDPDASPRTKTLGMEAGPGVGEGGGDLRASGSPSSPVTGLGEGAAISWAMAHLSPTRLTAGQAWAKAAAAVEPGKMPRCVRIPTPDPAKPQKEREAVISWFPATAAETTLPDETYR